MAYPVGGPGAHRYIVTEIHYDNPNMQEGELAMFLMPYRVLSDQSLNFITTLLCVLAYLISIIKYRNFAM